MPDAPLPPLAACFSCGASGCVHVEHRAGGFGVGCHRCRAQTGRKETPESAISEWAFLRAAVNLMRLLDRKKQDKAIAVEGQRGVKEHDPEDH